MANNVPDYRVTSPSEYKTGNGEVKTYFTDVGSGWKIKNGGVSIKLRPNIAVSGELVIFAVTATDDGPHSDDGEDEEPERTRGGTKRPSVEELEDEIPF